MSGGTNTTGILETYQEKANASEADSMLQNQLNVEKPEGTIRPEAYEVTCDDKRQRSFTRKALQNLVLEKGAELEHKTKLLTRYYDELFNSLADNARINEVLPALRTSTKAYEQCISEIETLYQQDKWSEFKNDASVTRDDSKRRLEKVYTLISKATERQDNHSENGSQKTRRSHRTASSKCSSSSSTARRTAMAEAAAAKERAQYDILIARKQHEKRQIEADELQRREQLQAKRDLEIAILTANKEKAVADAKLVAIEQAIQEEERPSILLDDTNEPFDSELRTKTWIDTLNLPQEQSLEQPEPAQSPGQTQVPEQPNIENLDQPRENIPTPTPRAFVATQEKETRSTPTLSTTFEPRGFAGNQPLHYQQETSNLERTNQKLVASLARQSLPKCHPDIFDGDATLFHPWKSAFKAMIHGADVSSAQEINYLRMYTSGDVQRLVDNYRKRHYNNPATALHELWTELGRRFGNTAAITNELIERLNAAAKFRKGDNAKLQSFADVCADIESQLELLPGLACLNYPNTIRPIVETLPDPLQSKWEKIVVNYADKHEERYPGFHTFSSMIQLQAKLKNHPSLTAVRTPKAKDDQKNDRPPWRDTHRRKIEADTRVLKSDSKEIDNEPPSRDEGYCSFHERNGHKLSECNAFRRKSLKEKNEFIREARLCFRCLTANHFAKDCLVDINCNKCGSDRHLEVLHMDKEETAQDEEVGAKCTAICKGRNGGRSCSKIVLFHILTNDQSKVERVYGLIDDQSNASMISPDLIKELNLTGPEEKYLLTTCSVEKEVRYGRRITGLVVRSLDGKLSGLPTLVECDHIPQDKSEIPTPEIANQFSHLRRIASEIPPLDTNSKIQILIGRDAPELMKVRTSINGPKGAPWAQKLDLGWTISGQVCLNRAGGAVHIAVYRTKTTTFPTSTEVTQCPNQFEIKERFYENKMDATTTDTDVYRTTTDDMDIGMSREDRRFLETMEKSIHKNERGNWEMPLPFRSLNTNLPNNRTQALNRLNGLLRTLKKKPQMKKDYIEFMAKLFDRGHAIVIPPNQHSSNHPPDGQLWYLPHFGVYHPKKPEQIRVVFDSSAEFQGVSLNKELLAGPDQMNSLFGVLIRFRQESVGVMCDVEQMFYSFHVNPEHRNFLRFLWFEDNDLSKDIVECQMTVHLFGNGPSPAVATFGMRKTADQGEEKFGTDAKEFVHRNFYVDDGLTSRATGPEVTDLVKKAQAMLATANLRLHKVVSNSVPVMESLPIEDRAKDVRDLDLRQDVLPAQRSLGVYWDLERDAFTFRLSAPKKPFTRRGVLSIVNSVFDPLGFITPVTLQGKLIFQALVILGKKRDGHKPLGWDDPLPEDMLRLWQRWRDGLVDLEKVLIPRCYHPKEFGHVTRREIHAFADASKDGIGVAVYLRSFNDNNEAHVAFLYGQSKVAPCQPTTIPRLELCAAVLATKAVRRIQNELSLEIDETCFYTDSKVVLGYIQNESRRFHLYVANRVQSIRETSNPSQWKYVNTTSNPADLATRGIPATNLMTSSWTTGPEFLKDTSIIPPIAQEEITLDINDPEIKHHVTVKTTNRQSHKELGCHRFTRFSQWSTLRRAVANLIVKAKDFKVNHNTRTSVNQRHSGCREGRCLPRAPSAEELIQAETVLIKAAQQESLATDTQLIEKLQNKEPTVTKACRSGKRKKSPLKKSTLYRLDPFVDDKGTLRVGGRLRRASLEYTEKHPTIIPKNHHLSQLLVRHYHNKVHHQGRLITHGTIRQAGYWIIGGHREVSKLLNSCVICRRLRAPAIEQRMADLPEDRLEAVPPFTNVGCDVFGPWNIRTKKLRGGALNSKRWGLLFTCLNSRAVHIEVIESMDASAFICGLRRFVAIRGPAKKIKCDCGTNFIGGKSELDEAFAQMDQKAVERYASEMGCEWAFNPPHASHFGGVWERQIGTIRRVLDAMLLELGSAQLTHELLVTLMAEATGIVNARPISTVPSDSDEPQPLSPSMLLTMKTRPLQSLPGVFDRQDLYSRRRWRRTQYLADQFWVRWRREYLQNLQRRPKWCERKRNLTVGDVVVLRTADARRNHWPLGRIVQVIQSEDGLVRKAEVKIMRDGEMKTYFRPISELVLIIPFPVNNACDQAKQD